MHWTAFLAYRRFPAHARVMDDCACVQCGYNLRTQMVSSRCPECGNEVGNSVFLLAKPAVASRGLRTAALTYLAPASILIAYISGAYWVLFVVSLTAVVAALFQFVGVTDLRRNAALARLPVVGARLSLWWAIALIVFIVALSWMGGLIVVSRNRILQNNGVGINIGMGGCIAWWMLNLISAWAAGRFGLALMDMLNFAWTRIEFRVQQCAIIGIIVLTLLMLITIRTVNSNTLKALLAGGLLLLTLLTMLSTAIALLHAATACDQSTEDWDELIESERIAVVPESQRRGAPEPPAIRVEGG